MNMEELKKKNEGVQDTDVVSEEIPTFANLTYDVGFKIVFGTEGKSENLLMRLLNSVLGMNIVSLEYLPTERLGLSQEESRSSFDVYCRDNSGRRFVVEMQMWSQHYYYKRAVFYSSRSVLAQCHLEKKYQKEILKRSNWNYYFAPVYVISFLNHPCSILEANKYTANPYVAHYVYKDKDSGYELQDGTNLIFVSLYRFKKQLEECKDISEQWLYSIHNMHLLNQIPEGVLGTELEELYHESRCAAWPAEIRELYEQQVMNANDYGNIIEESFENGQKAGTNEIAQRMKYDGIAIEIICKYTGLSIAEICAL